MLLRLALWSMLVGGAQDAHASGSLSADPMVATFVTATVEEGIWTWIERMEGEVLPEAAHEALLEDAAAHAVSDGRDEEIRGPDVPIDIYDDPVAALTHDPLYLDQIDPADYDIPIEIHPLVEERMRMFLGSHRKYFRRWIERKARYEPMILREAAAVGMPQDLVYLSMIESGFNTYAYSHASAGGLWQFIPTTAVMYDLEVDFWLDERRDPEKATKAAMQMLGELHRMFGDWYLAFAAYNTGPGRVRRALKRAKGDPEQLDYWDLVEQDLLHRETKGYVPKIIAAAVIAKNPERYGFTDLEPDEELIYETATIQGPVEVVVLAECAGISEDEFRALNPALRRYATPNGELEVRIPVDTREAFVAAYDAVPPSERIRIVKHKVRPGESLSVIAGKYGLSSSAVAKANGIRNVHRIRAGQWLVIPMKGAAAGTKPVASVQHRAEKPATGVSASEPSAPVEVPARHTVRSGEVLSVIAEKYELSTSDLQAWNGISNPRSLRVGQVLSLRAPSSESSASSGSGSESASTTPSTSASSGTSSTYTVRSGDTLSEIADKYDVSTSTLAAWNGITNPRSLRVGDKLVIKGGTTPAAPTTSTLKYTVRSGDTLSEIASSHGVSSADLKRWNGISDPRSLRVGQELTIQGDASAWTSHTVKRGDTLGGIASLYGVAIGDLRSWNNIRGNTIFPGQKLKLRKTR